MEFLISKISRRISDKIISEYGTGERVLEIGSHGKPSYTRFFPNRVGVDIKEGAGVDVVGSVYQLPFADHEFGMVLCMSVLEHLEDPVKAVREMRRVLKPEGRIIVSVPFLFPIHDAPGDYWRFTKYGLRKLFSDGWVIEKLVAETKPQEALAVLMQRFGYQTRLKLNKPLKVVVFFVAWLISHMPNVATKIFGDIHKKVEEPDAFASGFFLVARRP